MVKPLNVRGVIPATVLPFTEDFAIDEPALRSYMRWLADQGVAAVAVNADTGEGMHLTHDEKLRVAQIVLDEIGDRVPVIAGLGGINTQDAVRAARAYAALGVSAFLVFPIPAYRGQPLPPEVPYAYHAAIADAVDTPLILFQLQEALGGVLFPEPVLLKLVEIPSVIALKEASFDAVRFVETARALRQAPRKIVLLTGNDNFIYESYVLGAEGALIGYGTLFPDQNVAMYQAAMRKDFDTAAAIWERLRPLEEAVFAPPVRDYRARTKAVLTLQGIVPRATVRPPLLPLAEGEWARLRAVLERYAALAGAERSR